jgi:hypothetical protein
MSKKSARTKGKGINRDERRKKIAQKQGLKFPKKSKGGEN